MAKAMDDVLVAYGQNGEAARPGNGYPLRLIVPGWEGNVNVKWLRRIKVVDRPYMTRMEAPDHTSLLPSGKARQFLLRHGGEVGHHLPVRWSAVAGSRRV